MKLDKTMKDNLIFAGVVFYLWPLLGLLFTKVINLMSSAFTSPISLMLIYPIIVILLSIHHAKKEGFNVMFPVLLGLLFLPSALIFYGTASIIYPIVYAVLGAGAGYFITKK